MQESRRADAAADPSAPDRVVALVDRCLDDLAVPFARPAPHERGVSLPCEGWPLHVGIDARGPHLRAQAEVLGPGACDPWWLLHRNRRDLRVVRYATSSAGALWVHGDLPLAGVDAAAVDELLARVLEASGDARRRFGTAGRAV